MAHIEYNPSAKASKRPRPRHRRVPSGKPETGSILLQGPTPRKYLWPSLTSLPLSNSLATNQGKRADNSPSFRPSLSLCHRLSSAKHESFIWPTHPFMKRREGSIVPIHHFAVVRLRAYDRSAAIHFVFGCPTSPLTPWSEVLSRHS